jgi:hypothetical protein
MKYAQSFFIVPLTDDAGASNFVANGTTMNNSFISQRLNDTDASQRWYLLKNVKNAIIAERGDDVLESFDDGSSTFVEEGVATTSFIIASQTPTLIGKIKSHRCNKNGFFYVDKDGRLWGAGDTSGNLFPIAIEDQSLSVKAAYPTPTTNYNIPVSFKWRKDMFDEDLAYWDNSVTWSTPSLSSLLDVNALVNGNAGQTSFEVKLTYDYGAQNSKQVVESLVAGDFTLYNETDAASVAILSAVENPSGTYTITYSSQTISDVLTLSATKTGFDFSNLANLSLIVA